MSGKNYDFSETLQYLDGGVFAEKLSTAVKDVCAAVATHGDKGKTGKVTVELTIKRIGESTQVECVHKLVRTQPTAKGKRVEENTTETPLQVTQHGPSFIRSDQVDAFQADTEGQ